jgi:hypothetical protein
MPLFSGSSQVLIMGDQMSGGEFSVTVDIQVVFGIAE